MHVDKNYCMSSFLQFRTIADSEKAFSDGLVPRLWNESIEKVGVANGDALVEALAGRLKKTCAGKKVALALSGGIDSAILARLVPKGTTAYTFKCIVPGVDVTDESIQAAKYAKACGLEHKVVEITWADCEKYAPTLMLHKGAPMHSIEVQIYKAALQALADGCDVFVFGESADLNYGGLSGLLSRDWRVGEFIDRYNYVQPHHVLKSPSMIVEPYLEYVGEDGRVNVHEFCRGFFLHEAMGSYSNACSCAGIALETPYLHTRMSVPLDLERIRSGEGKYIVREAFLSLYPEWSIPPKTPMPRPMDEWMRPWAGPTRPEFWPHCTDGMTGDQKWLVWALERFLSLLDEQRC